MMNIMVSRRRWLLLTWLLLAVGVEAFAQFPVTTKKVNDFWKCKTEAQRYNTGKYLTLGCEYDVVEKLSTMEFCLVGNEAAERSVVSRCKKKSEGKFEAEDQTIILEFSNGEQLAFDESTVTSIITESKNIHIYLSIFHETAKSLSNMTEAQATAYVDRLLTTYEVNSITVMGQTFDISNLRTTPTFKKIYAELYEKTNHAFGASVAGRGQTSQSGIKVTFKNVWVEHNTFSNGEWGLTMHAQLDISNAKDQDCILDCFFFNTSGEPLKDFNERYCSADGQVMATTTFRPNYEQTTFSNISVFIPYAELHFRSGFHEAECRACVFHNGVKLAEANPVRFKVLY